MSETERSLYQRWLDSDPLLPGVSYVVVFSAGALAALLSQEMAILVLGVYLLVAAGINAGSAIERRQVDTETGRSNP